MEKRVKVIIDKKGNIQVETLQGFIGQQCHEAVDQVMQVLMVLLQNLKIKVNFICLIIQTNF